MTARAEQGIHSHGTALEGALAETPSATSGRVLADYVAWTIVKSVQEVARWLPERELLGGAKVLGYFFYYGAFVRSLSLSLHKQAVWHCSMVDG